jgi:glycosyltransferase involved in cell wall biosynthesis
MKNERLKIAMFGHKRIPSREGGVEIVVEELATRMTSLNYSVTCYNRKGQHVAGTEFNQKILDTYKGVKLKSIFSVNCRGLAALTSSVFGAFHSAFGKYDVVHIHAEGPAFMCWLPKLMGKRVIVTVHGLDWGRTKWGKIASWYIRTGEKMAVKYADEIIVLSQGVKDYFSSEYGRETRFIPNGVNRPEIADVDEIKKKWGLEKEGYILYLGRIVPEKGEHYLVEAFKKINTDKKLVIAGGLSDTAEYGKGLKELAAGDERIIFTGFVQGRMLDELYSNCLIYCLPSDLEGMPLSLLEAMSYGNCCLVSDILECAEVVEDKAVTFMKGDINNLKKKLEWLLNHENEIKIYSNEAADFICNKYSWDDVVEKTIRLYRGE